MNTTKKDVARKNNRPKQPDIFGANDAGSGNCGFYYTNGQAITLAADNTYERLTGLQVGELYGRHMKELVETRYFNHSVTLMVLEQRRPVSITQHILKTGRKVLVTGNPIFDQEGNVILVVTTVNPFIQNNSAEMPKPLPTNHLVNLPEIGTVVAESQAMKEVVERAIRAAASDATVLIQGESGVGKEVVARIIHEYSPRKDKPFVVVNAAAIPGELFEAEMFGYRRGAFTGARSEGSPGLVKAADGGTLFLDEISEVSLPAQAKLLRLIQNKELYPLGATRPEKVNVRFITASNQNLRQLVEARRFRQDLYYRLNVVPIYIPPLIKRNADIAPLIDHFFKHYSSQYNRQLVLTPNARQELLNYNWPGNVRELQNMIERLVVLSPANKITSRMVIKELTSAVDQNYLNQFQMLYPFHHDTNEDLITAVENFEKELIARALNKYSTIEQAAQALGVHRTTLARKTKKYFS
ncbi:sigma-54 interaction domain-containing protein [Desulfotomaculum nigrificans]|uniref:sigma-54 interaction domain-containing protein n=1 Tax=Desulfotomaculum nigrificans TaxID=1565 RepID=UPI0001FAE80A|nr:sigma-54-dependent Fis family transcriptional regulator [Desulfotomaculum nigrificans]